MITFRCEHCNEELSVPDNTAGKKGKCPHCGKIVQIPTASTVGEEQGPEGMIPEGDFTPSPPRERPSREREREREEDWERDRDVEERPRRSSPSGGGVLTEPSLEMAVMSIILGVTALVGVELMIPIRLLGVFPALIVGLARVGLAAFGLVLGIMGIMKTVQRGAPGFWSNLVGIIICGCALLVSLVLFIMMMTASRERITF
jgi:phage FluMu protein Com